MAETTETRVCPFCAESLKVSAKVCPHCRYWQKKWSWQNPVVGPVIGAGISLIFLIGLGAFLDKMFGLKEAFEVHQNDFSIVSSQFSHRVQASNVWLTVVGTITNRGDWAWKNVDVEVQFYDKTGKMIDVIAVDGSSYHGTALLPHRDAAFKVESRASHPAADYDNYKALVRWGKDANAWP